MNETSNNLNYQLSYDLITAGMECDIHEHPQEQMKKLGYKIIDAIP